MNSKKTFLFLAASLSVSFNVSFADFALAEDSCHEIISATYQKILAAQEKFQQQTDDEKKDLSQLFGGFVDNVYKNENSNTAALRVYRKLQELTKDMKDYKEKEPIEKQYFTEEKNKTAYAEANENMRTSMEVALKSIGRNATCRASVPRVGEYIGGKCGVVSREFPTEVSRTYSYGLDLMGGQFSVSSTLNGPFAQLSKNYVYSIRLTIDGPASGSEEWNSNKSIILSRKDTIEIENTVLYNSEQYKDSFDEKRFTGMMTSVGFNSQSFLRAAEKLVIDEFPKDKCQFIDGDSLVGSWQPFAPTLIVNKVITVQEADILPGVYLDKNNKLSENIDRGFHFPITLYFQNGLQVALGSIPVNDTDNQEQRKTQQAKIDKLEAQNEDYCWLQFNLADRDLNRKDGVITLDQDFDLNSPFIYTSQEKNETRSLFVLRNGSSFSERSLGYLGCRHANASNTEHVADDIKKAFGAELQIFRSSPAQEQP